jgi:hypothetical protein
MTATKLVLDLATGEEKVIPLTPEEIAAMEQMQAAAEAARAEQEALELANSEAKASGIAKLLTLGLTEAEAQALVN